MKISFVGDVMLGRFVARKYQNEKYDIVAPELIKEIAKSDYVVANLESPVTFSLPEATDHLVFQGSIETLKQFQWVDCFSLSNNHINDCGILGMDETIISLDQLGFRHNGLFKGDEYSPILINGQNSKIAMITCTDMMNQEFDEDCPWKTLRIDDPLIDETIKRYKSEGYYIIFYPHVGMLFTRFPNPQIRDFIHEKIDLGVDLVITVHPHVLGGRELYKGKNIFYSLGDFVMDGNSFRRRNSGVVVVDIENNELKSWDLICATTDENLQTSFSTEKVKKKMLKSFEEVSRKLADNRDNYDAFYKKQYKKEMIQHSLSTVTFIFKTKGFKGLIRLLYMRMDAVWGMFKRVVTDRSKMRYDSDAVDHKNNHSIDDIS